METAPFAEEDIEGIETASPSRRVTGHSITKQSSLRLPGTSAGRSSRPNSLGIKSHSGPNSPCPKFSVTHKHNITIAINDEPVDKIRMKCTSPACETPKQYGKWHYFDWCKTPAFTYHLTMGVLCFGWVSVMGAAGTVLNWYSTLFGCEGKLGIISLICCFVCSLLASLITPSLVSKFGPKFSTILGSISIVVWIIPNLYPASYLILPATSFFGFGVSLLQTAQSNYLSQLNEFYSFASHNPPPAFANALYRTLFKSAPIWGNLLFSLTYWNLDKASRQGFLMEFKNNGTGSGNEFISKWNESGLSGRCFRLAVCNSEFSGNVRKFLKIMNFTS